MLPLIVAHFQNRPLTEKPRNLTDDYFQRHVETVTAFSERVGTMPTRAAQKAFQEVCLLGLHDSKVGLYSNFHDFAIWKHGLDSPEAVRMAYMYVIRYHVDVLSHPD